MEKKLKLYYLDGKGSIQPFPNANEQVVLSDFSYNAQRMGGAPTISASLMYESCLDNQWTDTVFTTFNKEKYYLSCIPSSHKDNEDGRYRHELQLISERVILENVYFYDVVSAGFDDHKYVSNSTTVFFFGNVKEFAKRLNESLKYSKIGYSVVVDDLSEFTLEEKQITFENKFFSEVLQEVYNVFDVPYYIDGKTIHIGKFKESHAITDVVFKYGYDANLIAISKNNENNKIINRIAPEGSEENIPYYYPNDTPSGNVALETGNPTLTYHADLETLVNKTSFVDRFVYTNKKISAFDFLTNKEEDRTFHDISDRDPHEAPHPIFRTDLTQNQSSDLLLLSEDARIVLKKNASHADSNHLVKARFRVEEYGNPSNIVFSWDSSKGYADINETLNLEKGKVYVARYHARYEDIEGRSKVEPPLVISVDIDYNYWTLNEERVKLEEFGIFIDSGSPAVGDKFWVTQVSYMRPSGRLMPPIYRDTNGAYRFYNAKNNTYLKDGGGFYEFSNEYTDGKPKEHFEVFDDIKPSIKGMVNSNSLRVDQFADIAFDKDDNNEKEETENGLQYKHPYFFVKLRKTIIKKTLNGKEVDFSFNLFDSAIEGKEMTIDVTSGQCGGHKFMVAVDEKDKKSNLVQVDSSGALMRDKETGRVICTNVSPQDIQQDTSKNEVWIALKKDITSNESQVMPYTKTDDNGIITYVFVPKPNEDTFVITNIKLPKAYIIDAEERLKKKAIDFMFNNNSEYFNFSIDFSRIFLEENKEISDNLCENSRIKVNYNGIIYDLFVNSYSYRIDGDSVLPEISVELKDKVGANESLFRNALGEIKKDVMLQIGNIDVVDVCSRHFVSKTNDDIVEGSLRFNKHQNFNEGATFGEGEGSTTITPSRGIVTNQCRSKNFSEGTMGKGFSLGIDKSDGLSYMEIDKLFVRVKAMFSELDIRKISYSGGTYVFSPAGAKCVKVLERADYYVCYLGSENKNGRVYNEFKTGDLIKCQEFGLVNKDTGETYNRAYWRLCVAAENDYVCLSKKDAALGGDVPMEGDTLVCLGHKGNDSSRKNAIIIASYGSGSPYIKEYKDIDSYTLEGKDVVVISPIYNKFTGEFILSSNGLSVEESIAASNKALQENLDVLVGDVDSLKKQNDGAVEFWFGKDRPTDDNEPTKTWITEGSQEKHLADMYYADDNSAWRYSKDDKGNYIWKEVVDSASKEALDAAKKAQEAADGKVTVFVSQPTNQHYKVGDIWMNANYSDAQGRVVYKNDLLRCQTERKKDVGFNIADWIPATRYTDDAVAKDAKDKAEKAAQDIIDVNNKIDKVASDNYLTPDEKRELRAEILTIEQYHSSDIALASYYLSKESELFKINTSAYETRYKELNDFLDPILATNSGEDIDGSKLKDVFYNYYVERALLLESISKTSKDLAASAQNTADNALTNAQNAATAARNASADAKKANDTLTRWTSDAIISPTEKLAIKEESIRISSEKDQIVEAYSKYELGEPTTYIEYYNTYHEKLDALCANMTIESNVPDNFEASQTNYYNERSACLIEIERATRQYVYDNNIGNPNLCKNSASVLSGVDTSRGNNLITSWNSLRGQQITVSFDYDVSMNTGSDWRQRIGVEVSYSGGYFGFWKEFGSNRVVSESGRYSETKVVPNIESSKGDGFNTYIQFINGLGSARVFNIKIEIGNVATKWSPCPEYVSANFKTLNDRITASVNSTKEYTNGKIRSVNTRLDVTNGRIDSEVEARTQLGDKVSMQGTLITQNADKISATSRTVDSHGERIGAIEVRSDEIDLTVKNLVAGGENLLWNSTLENSTEWYEYITSGMGFVELEVGKPKCLKITKYNAGIYQHLGYNAELGQEYTSSVDVYSKEGGHFILLLGIENGSGNYRIEVDLHAGEWTRVFNTQKMEQTHKPFIIYNGQDGVTLYYRNAQLEKGNVGSGWKPSAQYEEDRLKDTGINIRDKEITLTANKLSVVGNNGVKVVDFISSDSSGNPVVKAKNLNIDNIVAKDVDVSGQIKADQLRLNPCTHSENGYVEVDGSLILGFGRYILPKLANGESMSIRYVRRMRSRTLEANTSFKAATDCTIFDTYDTLQGKKSIELKYGMYEIFGVDVGGMTDWYITQISM